MIEHVVRWYEAEDGNVFTDDIECLVYEVNLLYQKSGVKLYKGDKRIDAIDIEDDRTYNEVSDIFIDRSKADKNEDFREALYQLCGWCLIDEALLGSGKHYRFIDSSACKTDVVEVK